MNSEELLIPSGNNDVVLAGKLRLQFVGSDGFRCPDATLI
jgi:hypothetical protein